MPQVFVPSLLCATVFCAEPTVTYELFGFNVIRAERFVVMPSMVTLPVKLPVVADVELDDLRNDNVAFTSEVFATAPFEVEVHSIRPSIYLFPVGNVKLPLAIARPPILQILQRSRFRCSCPSLSATFLICRRP